MIERRHEPERQVDSPALVAVMRRLAMGLTLLAIPGCSTGETPSPADFVAPFVAACVDSPLAPTEHLTSNAVMPTTSIESAPALEELGVLRSFLEASPGASRKVVTSSIEGDEYALEVFTLPAGTSLYKSLGIPTSGLTPQGAIDNPYATSTNWYSSREVAESYANSEWGKANGFKVVEFAARRELTLINLASSTNLRYVARALDADVAYLEAGYTAAKAQAPANSPAVTLAEAQLDSARVDRKILALTTGVGATYEQQLEWLLELGATPTFNSEWPAYSPSNELDKRGISATDTFGIQPDGTSASWKPVTLLTGCDANPETRVRWGGGADDLNRVSFSTGLDKQMTRIIERTLNVDGYFSPPAPSLFHGSGRLVEEVAIFDPGDSTTIVEVLGGESP